MHNFHCLTIGDERLNLLTTIAESITESRGYPYTAVSMQALSGGDINSAYRINGKDKDYFVKLNRADLVPMFKAEAAGLLALAASRTMRIPAPVASGQTQQQAFLVLDYIEFGTPSKSSHRLLGQQLAELHQQPQPCFGWQRDNTIGSTPQMNTQNHHWPSFWREQRLEFQLKLAARKGYGGKLQTMGARLCSDLAILLQHHPQPSLLHGDLWSGNAAVDQQGLPVIFDPACYYGDREVDLAMTELFGGFSPDFYAAYQATWPLDPGYSTRKTLYNLYHILNHLNLFGGSYLRQAENMLASLLAEL